MKLFDSPQRAGIPVRPRAGGACVSLMVVPGEMRGRQAVLLAAGVAPEGPVQTGAHYHKYRLKPARADTRDAGNGQRLEELSDALLQRLVGSAA